MELVRNAYEAVCQRKSVRSYRREIIPQKMFHHILRFQGEIQPLDPDCRIQWQVINAIEGKCPMKGHFLVKAPYYLVIHSEDKPGALRNAGYMMEQMVIFLTMKGIGTCYQGDARVPALGDGTKPMLVIAFGYPAEELYRDEYRARRKPMSQLCSWREEGSTVVKKVVKAAILSPSAMNRQPWRFVYSKGRLHLFVKKAGGPGLLTGRLQEADCGIAMANAVLAAEEMWMDAAWTTEECMRTKELSNLDYVASLDMKET